MELDADPRPELEELERFAGAELVVGLIGPELRDEGGTTVAMVREALGKLAKIPRAVVICNNGAHGPAPVSEKDVAADDSPEDSPEDSQDHSLDHPLDHSLAILSFGQPPPGPAGASLESRSRAYRRVLTVGEKVSARACAVIVSRPQAATPQWIYRLVQPVLELPFDLVAPRYARHKMEGLLNRSVLCPLHRALYGEQLQNPMGPDFGLSGKLLRQVLAETSGPRQRDQSDLMASIASTAARNRFHVCESHLGVRNQQPTDWANLSSLIAEVLGPVFLEMERQAAFWQGTRGSKAVAKMGAPEDVSGGEGTVDVRRMIESFQLGAQNLQDVWGIILPPTTLLELRRLARVLPDQFRMPDELWVRIVYDFALGHRLRTISRDHLLRSITPLYLGWIASYALETEGAGAGEVELRTERLCETYEANKAYLVSRWRWPDRFNP